VTTPSWPSLPVATHDEWIDTFTTWAATEWANAALLDRYGHHDEARDKRARSEALRAIAEVLRDGANMRTRAAELRGQAGLLRAWGKRNGADRLDRDAEVVEAIVGELEGRVKIGRAHV